MFIKWFCGQEEMLGPLQTAEHQWRERVEQLTSIYFEVWKDSWGKGVKCNVARMLEITPLLKNNKHICLARPLLAVWWKSKATISHRHFSSNPSAKNQESIDLTNHTFLSFHLFLRWRGARQSNNCFVTSVTNAMVWLPSFHSGFYTIKQWFYS